MALVEEVTLLLAIQKASPIVKARVRTSDGPREGMPVTRDGGRIVDAIDGKSEDMSVDGKVDGKLESC